MSSKLILCANHLGNPKDIPNRTIEALKECDIVFCEDTRSCARLLSSLEIGKPLKSYFNYNEQKRVDELRIQLKKESVTIALISEAGMPLIADPGYRIVNLFHELGLPIQAIPGPSAFLAVLIMSGFPLQSFSFVGFWPDKKRKQTSIFRELQELERPIAFYESPMRILKTLKAISLIIPRCQVFVAKELTKPYETYWRGNIVEVTAQIENSTLKGEFCVVLYYGERGEEEDSPQVLSPKASK